MKKLAAALLVVLVAGCSDTGMSMRSGTSGGSGMSSYGRMGGRPTKNEQEGVIDPSTGQLNPYHGG